MDNYSRAYHKYFDGYREYKEWNPQLGRCVIRRVYTGAFYRHAMGNRQWKRWKFCQGMAYFVTMGLYLGAGVCFRTAGTTKGAVLFNSLSLLSLLWISPALLRGLFAGRNMKLREYQDTITVKTAALAAGMCLMMNGLAVLRQICRIGGWKLWPEAVCPFFYFAAGLCMLYISRMGEGMEYEKLANSAGDLEEAYEIVNPHGREGV